MRKQAQIEIFYFLGCRKYVDNDFHDFTVSCPKKIIVLKSHMNREDSGQPAFMQSQQSLLCLIR